VDDIAGVAKTKEKTSWAWRTFVRNCQRMDQISRLLFPPLYAAFILVMNTQWLLDTYSEEAYARGTLS